MKRIFNTTTVFIVVLMLLGGQALLAGEKDVKNTPRVIKGAKELKVAGTLVQWQDLPKIDLSKVKNRKMKPVMNFKNPKKIKKKSKDVDPVVQTDFGTPGGLSKDPLAVVSGTNFAGMNFTANGNTWPSDANGDVGPSTYYVQTVNTSIGIFDKNTGVMIGATTFDSFFPSSVGSPCDANNNGDPIVLYDRCNQRWFILDFAWPGAGGGASHFSIAASQTSNPAGAWWTYCLQVDPALVNDYPKCGVWDDGIYATADMFTWTGLFQHVKIWAFKTPDIYTGTLTSQSVTDNGVPAKSILPSNDKDPNCQAGVSPNYMFAMDADEFGGTSQDTLYMWKYSVDWVSPANTTWTGPQQALTAPFGLSAAGVPQLDTAYMLDPLYGLLMYPANYWDFGSHESVVLCHVCDYNNRRAMRWYEVRLPMGNLTIHQQGTYSPDASHRWMGSIAINSNGSIGMGYSVSSSSMYPAIRYCGRLSTDPPGCMSQGEATMIAGTGSQTSFVRWGDYTSCFVDSQDDLTFWYTNQYLTSMGTDWQTRIGSFTVNGTPLCTLSQAMDTGQTFTTTCGTVGFTCDVDFSHDGVDSARSLDVNDNQTACMETVVTLAQQSVISFWWKVSSEANYDYLKFYIDSVEQPGTISGEVNWQQQTFNLAAGTYTLRWEYSKDASVGTGLDCGWVDYLEIYCSTSATNQAFEWISQVQVGGINNPSGASPYSDFTNLIGSITRSASEGITLTPGFSGSSYNETWIVWIDYNQDGDFFDAGEKVFTGAGTGLISGSFTVPAAALPGCTRMRVSMRYGIAATPCLTFTFGEVEDYTMIIL